MFKWFWTIFSLGAPEYWVEHKLAYAQAHLCRTNEPARTLRADVSLLHRFSVYKVVRVACLSRSWYRHATRMTSYGPRDLYALITREGMQERLSTNSLLLFVSSWIVTHLPLPFSHTYFGPHKKRVPPIAIWLRLTSPIDIRDLTIRHQTATSVETSLKNRLRILSIYFAIIPSRPVTWKKKIYVAAEERGLRPSSDRDGRIFRHAVSVLK